MGVFILGCTITCVGHCPPVDMNGLILNQEIGIDDLWQKVLIFEHICTFLAVFHFVGGVFPSRSQKKYRMHIKNGSARFFSGLV